MTNGSIFLRGTTYWVQYTDDSGVRRRVSTKTKDRSKALDILNKLKEGTTIFKVVTVDEILDNLLWESKVKGLKDIKSLEARLNSIRKVLGRKLISSIDNKVINDYITYRKSDDRSNATINRELQTLHSAMQSARRDGYDLEIPKMPSLREPPPRHGTLLPEDLERLCTYLPEYLRNFTRLAYITGARRGELVNLTWNRVYQDHLVFYDTKNGESRPLPMIGRIKEIIDEQREFQQGPYVFHREGIKVGDFRVAWNTARRAIGMPDLLFHDLRRSAVTNLIRSGVPRQVAMRISGHKTETVFNRYHIVDDEDIKDALGRL